MPTITLLYFDIILLILISSNGPNLVLSSPTIHPNRRILHQPFFPLDSTPTPPQSPPTPKFPFSTSTPPQHSFFPTYPSPPPPPPQLNPSPFASFPANISSLILPHSPSPNPVSKKLIAVTVSLSISAALIASIALIFYFRRSRRSSHKDIVTPTRPPAPTAHLPKQTNSGARANSSEFLYLGTLVNNSVSINNNRAGVVTGARGSFEPRKLDSPELHPLPPLIMRQKLVNHAAIDEDQDEFYSPRGSISGRENKSVNQAEKLGNDNNGGNSYNLTTSSSSSSSNSPLKSASISISPPITNPKSSSSPEFIELTLRPQATPPASPPLPEMTFSPPYSPSSVTSSKKMKEVDEAEESPLLSNDSSSSLMSSPPQSPRLSPLKGKIGRFSPEEREWNVSGRNSPSPAMSNDSISSRKSSFSSLKLPAFLGGGKRKSSIESTSVTNSPVSPHSPASVTSRLSRSYPASPLSNSSDGKKSLSNRINSFVPAPPPPPPLPTSVRRYRSPQVSVSEGTGIATGLRSVVVEKPKAVESSASMDSEETMQKPKLKPLHWDKVKASSDREMVWDQFRSSSFKLDEEMIETLFVVNTPNPNQKEAPQNPIQPWPRQENRVLDPKKAQNIAILLRALNVTMEEVCEALMEGNADTLGTELLESFLKMAPTKEEERKLIEYKDDSPVKLGHAEKFIKAVIDIPFAFKRVEAMLYIANFESEIEYLKKSFETLEVACDELRSSRMFLKLLEAVLKTGNRMNVGTNRGEAQAFKLDTLLKLVDIKGADGKTTLLHFVVQEIIRTEGQRLSVANNQASNDEPKCRKLGLQVVSSLSSELANVKKSAAMDSEVLSNDVAKLTLGLGKIGEVVKLIDQVNLQDGITRFSESMHKFMKMAEEDIFRVQAQERVTLSLVKEITEYFHGNSAKEEAHPFRIFMVVRDFLTVLDRVCKEVGMINERTLVSSAHRFPVPVNPMLPVPVNPFHPQVLPGFPALRQSSSSDDESP